MTQSRCQNARKEWKVKKQYRYWLAVTYNPAMTSISTSASFGSRATCTVDRAGGAALKYPPYTSFMAAKSFRSLRKTVVFSTWPRFTPAASRMPFTFCSTRSVCRRMSAPASSPVLGSSATCPERYKNPLARMACEYGPMGFGPRSVRTVSFIVWSPLKYRRYSRLRLRTVCENPPEHPAASSTRAQIRRRFGAFPVRMRLSDRLVRIRAPAGHPAYGAWRCETLPVRTCPAARKRRENSLPGAQSGLPAAGSPPFPGSSEERGESSRCGLPRLPPLLCQSTPQRPEKRKAAVPVRKNRGSAHSRASSKRAKAPPRPRVSASQDVDPPPPYRVKPFRRTPVPFRLPPAILPSRD